MVDNGPGSTTKMLMWILGIAMMVLFAAVGLIVQDVREDIGQNHHDIGNLERRLMALEGAVHQEQRLTQQYREWFAPRLEKLEQGQRELQAR